MRYEEKALTLKSGRLCLLKSPTGEDAEGMLSYLKQIPAETAFLTRYEDEVTVTVEEEKLILAAILDDPKEIMISAFIDGKLVGNASVGRVSPIREKHGHRADFGIAIIREFWNSGLGTALVSAAIDSAEAAGYEQLELEVAAKNERAVALYEKFGFWKFGTRPDTFRNRDGSYSDFHLMMKKL